MIKQLFQYQDTPSIPNICLYLCIYYPGKDGTINKLSADDLHLEILQRFPETDPDTLILR